MTRTGTLRQQQSPLEDSVQKTCTFDPRHIKPGQD
jgi:hypothetical protein